VKRRQRGSRHRRIPSFGAGPESLSQLTGVSTLTGRGRSPSLGDLSWASGAKIASVTGREGVFLPGSSLPGLGSRKLHVGESTVVLYGVFLVSEPVRSASS